jgi:hypothetical protein
VRGLPRPRQGLCLLDVRIMRRGEAPARRGLEPLRVPPRR